MIWRFWRRDRITRLEALRQIEKVTLISNSRVDTLSNGVSPMWVTTASRNEMRVSNEHCVTERHEAIR